MGNCDSSAQIAPASAPINKIADYGNNTYNKQLHPQSTTSNIQNSSPYITAYESDEEITCCRHNCLKKPHQNNAISSTLNVNVNKGQLL